MLAALLIAGATVSCSTLGSQIGVVGAVVVLFAAPLCALGSALFLARSRHHLAFAFVLAPLLVAAIAGRAFPTVPLGAATLVQAAIFWSWHVPALYEGREG